MQQLPARIEDLPASLVDVAETLGLRVAVAMIEHFGGLEVRIPVVPGCNNAPDEMRRIDGYLASLGIKNIVKLEHYHPIG